MAIQLTGRRHQVGRTAEAFSVSEQGLHREPNFGHLELCKSRSLYFEQIYSVFPRDPSEHFRGRQPL